MVLLGTGACSSVSFLISEIDEILEIVLKPQLNIARRRKSIKYLTVTALSRFSIISLVLPLLTAMKSSSLLEMSASSHSLIKSPSD